MIAEANGEADQLLPPLLCEYARLLHDTGQHEKAIPIFAQAMTALEDVIITDRDPVGFALFLDDFAASLNAIGATTRAAEIQQQADAIKTQHAGHAPKFVPRRYTGFCN